MKIIYMLSCVENGGIYRCGLDDGGRITIFEKYELDRPMYSVKDSGYMYTLLRSPFNNDESGVVRHQIVEDGKLVLDNAFGIRSTKGVVACHLAVEGDDVYCANYLSGSVIKLSDILRTHSGKGIHATRQEAPHTHFTAVSNDKKYVYVVDLGVDKIYVYNRNLELCSFVKLPDGLGPRHLAFHSNNKTVFCVNELDSSVSVLEREGDRLIYKETVAVLREKVDNTCAAIRCVGNFVYVSNRGHDSISCLEYKASTLKLLSVTHCAGISPRDFNIYSNLLICANETSDNVTLFNVNGACLTQKEQQINIEKPLCVVL